MQVSDRPDLAEFQCNGALAAAKLAKANPRAIAEKIAARLRESPLIGEAVIAGPGFINLKLAPSALEQRLQSLYAQPERALPESGKGKRVIVDFGGPNIAKPMHVGHLRSSIIGDSLQRLFRANGWTVTSDVHLGDWGLPMGQLIAELAVRRPDLPYFDPADRSPYPKESPVTMDDLEEMYPQPRPRPAKPIRSGSKPRASRPPSCKRAGPAIARCGSISTMSPRSGLTREFASLGCRVRRVERRIRRRSADPRR